MRIGCQGWNYVDWVTKAGETAAFYPRSTKSSEMLQIYAQAFETVEVDSTFYAVPQKSTLESWSQKTPIEFRFALKLPQTITHENALQPSGFATLNEFCENVGVLGEKLAAVLIQLPPQFEATQANNFTFQNFLRELPANIRFAVEFRERGWFDAQIFEVLAKNNVALCLTEGHWIPRATTFHAASQAISDFAYVRFMGERDLTRFNTIQREQRANLELWRETLQNVAASTSNIFVYFSNFYEGFAPASANKLKQLFGQRVVEPTQLENQLSLF